MKMKDYIFLNGSIISEKKGYITVKERGFLYGDGIYETLRTYHEKPFKLPEHLNRLRSSAEKLKIPLEYTDAELRDTIQELVKKNNTPDAYIRITLSRGLGCQGLVMNDNPKPTLLIQARPHTPYRKELYEKGMSLIISKARRSTSCPISCHKTTNLLTSILLKEEAKRRSADEALILNTDNEVAEGIISNIFMVKNGNVITPSLETNILPGITRKTVLNICKDRKISSERRTF